ncbi:MAG: prephenate dehydrogenase/arogenate dehydrogenase family protein [Candidatus Absconditabacteria bacterium]
MKKVTIIGGTSGFGLWCGKYLLSKFTNEIELLLVGTNIEKGKKVAKDLGVKFTIDNISAVVDADVVIVSVPINITDKIIRSIGKYLKKGAIFIDVTSVKLIPSIAMQESVLPGVIVIPMHPMFGPYVTNIVGQVIVLTPNNDVKQVCEYKQIKNFLKTCGAKVIETTPQEHDKFMSVVQGLTHFSLFVMAETMRRLDFDIEFSQNFVSPVYKIMISTIARYMNQNPSLYAQIQMNNPLNHEVQEMFLKVSQEFKDLTMINYEKGFVDLLNKSSDYFGKESQKGQKYTDKIIYFIGKQLEVLKNNIGNNIKIENIYDKRVIEGKLESIEDDFFWLNGEKFIIDEWIIN